MEASSDIELHPGEEYSLAVGSLGGAGYEWMFDINGLQDVICVYPGPPGPPGEIEPSPLHTRSVEHVFVIKAMGAGKAEARFVLRRPWQKEAPPVQVISVKVTVK